MRFCNNPCTLNVIAFEGIKTFKTIFLGFVRREEETLKWVCN